MIIKVNVKDQDLTDFEFGKACEASEEGCDHPAEWAVWVSHNVYCRQHTALICDEHKNAIEAQWTDLLRTGGMCGICGATIRGQLSEHFRVIKL